MDLFKVQGLPSSTARSRTRQERHWIAETDTDAATDTWGIARLPKRQPACFRALVSEKEPTVERWTEGTARLVNATGGSACGWWVGCMDLWIDAGTRGFLSGTQG